MRNFRRLRQYAAIAAAACIVTACSSTPGTGDRQHIAALGFFDVVDGQSMAEWTIDWWQWAFSMNQRQSPVRDRTGALCGTNQAGPVWFLAGAYGVDRVIRYCTVPPGKHLFFPLINFVQAPGTRRDLTCAMARRNVVMRDPGGLDLWVRLDGRELAPTAPLRLESPDCFDLTARAPFGTPRQYPAASGGFWVMLPPLPPGEHVLQFGAVNKRAADRDAGMLQDIEYVLTVATE